MRRKYVAASRNVKKYEKVFRIFSEEQKRYEETPPNAISEACQSNPRIRCFDKCSRVFPHPLTVNHQVYVQFHIPGCLYFIYVYLINVLFLSNT